MSKAMADDLLPTIYTLANEDEGIGHVVGPGCEGAGAVDYDVLDGLELAFAPFLYAEGDLVVDEVGELGRRFGWSR